MKKPSLTQVLPVLAGVYVPPLFYVAVETADGGKVTQKLPPAHGISVATTASSSDTGAKGPAVVVEMNTGKRIVLPAPAKPGVAQLDTGGISDTDDDPTDTG